MVADLRSRRELAVEYGWTWLGTPYEWGDEDFSGMDCSGFFTEVLCATGREPHGARLTAVLISERYPRTSVIRSGCGACYGKTKVTHVMLCINEVYVIGSTGGDSTTKTLADADKAAAFVKVRPLHYRRDLLWVVDPFAE